MPSKLRRLLAVEQLHLYLFCLALREQVAGQLACDRGYAAGRALAELRKLSLDPDGFVFASETGKTPIWCDNLWRRYMRPR